MNAQATRLGTVSENIANSDTTGYKQSTTQFSSLILPSSSSGYNSGAVEAQVRALVSEQGGISYTGNDNNPKSIDIAIDGNGFLAVGDGNGGTFLTRAGSFTQQADGTLVNSAGYTLQGYPVNSTGVDSVLNGFQGLQDINLKTALLSANPTTKGTLTVPLNQNFTTIRATQTQTSTFSASGGTTVAGDTLNFDVIVDGTSRSVSITAGAGGISAITSQQVVDAINGTTGLSGVASLSDTGKLVLKANGSNSSTDSTIELTNVSQTVATAGTEESLTGLTAFAQVKGVAGLPSKNAAALPIAENTRSTSITVYAESGEAVKLDVYYTKTNDNKWEVAVFDSRKATTGTATSPFPYGKAGDAPLATSTLNFDSKGTLESIGTGTNSAVPSFGIMAIDLKDIGGGNFNLDLGNTTQLFGDNQPIEAAVDGNPAEVVSKISVGVDGTVTAIFASGTKRDLFKVPLALVNSPNSLVAHAGNAYSVGVESGTVLMGFGGSDGFGKVTAGALEDSTVDLASELTTMIESQRSYTANSKVFQTGSEILDVLVNLKR